MYCDKDTTGRVAIMDLTDDELETIRRALTAFRVGLVHNRPQGIECDAEAYTQYERAGAIVHHIEALE